MTKIPSGIKELDQTLGGGYGPGLHVVTGHRNTGVTRFLFRLIRNASKALPAGTSSYWLLRNSVRLTAEQELSGRNVQFRQLNASSIEEIEKELGVGLVVIDQVTMLNWSPRFPITGNSPADAQYAGLAALAQQKNAIIIASYNCTIGPSGPPTLLQSSLGSWDLEAAGAVVGKRSAGIISRALNLGSPGRHADERTFIFDPASFNPVCTPQLEPGAVKMRHCSETQVVYSDRCDCGAWISCKAGRGNSLHDAKCPWRKQ